MKLDLNIALPKSSEEVNVWRVQRKNISCFHVRADLWQNAVRSQVWGFGFFWKKQPFTVRRWVSCLFLESTNQELEDLTFSPMQLRFFCLTGVPYMLGYIVGMCIWGDSQFWRHVTMSKIVLLKGCVRFCSVVSNDFLSGNIQCWNTVAQVNFHFLMYSYPNVH